MAVMIKERDYYVHTSMVDTEDKIRPASILDLYQDLAGVHAEELGVGFGGLVKLGLFWVILYEEFETNNSYIPFGSKVIVKTWPRSRNRLEFEREYEMYSEVGEFISKGISTWCVINSETRKLERADKVVFNGEYYDKTNYPPKLSRKISFPEGEPDLVYEHKVLWGDLDHNMHMNNAKYLEVIYNMHVNDKKLKKCRIAFISEAHYGETINILYKHYNGLDYYLGMVNGKECFISEITTEG